jgi:hypothetical protein
MAELNRQGRYDRMTDAMYKLTGEAPTNMRDFVKLHAAEFKQRGPAHSRIVTMPESRAAGAHRDSP